MLSQIGRAAIKRIGAETPRLSTNLNLRSVWKLQRVGASDHSQKDSRLNTVALPSRRFYATASKATQTTDPKPKASVTRKPRAKTTVSKKVAKKTSTKPTAKPVKKKPAPKLKAKPVKKAKLLTPEQRKVLAEKRRVMELSEAALLNGPGKAASITIWNKIISETLRGKEKPGSPAGSRIRFTECIKEAKERFQSLTPAEIEVYNHTINQEKADAVITYKQWVESHTPEQIRLANNARSTLRRKGLKGKRGFGQLPKIEDSRLPTRGRNSFMFFVKDRVASGDFKGLRTAEYAKLLGKEWAELPVDEQKVFKDRASSDASRYRLEYKTVYHQEPGAKSAAA